MVNEEGLQTPPVKLGLEFNGDLASKEVEYLRRDLLSAFSKEFDRVRSGGDECGGRDRVNVRWFDTRKVEDVPKELWGNAALLLPSREPLEGDSGH